MYSVVTGFSILKQKNSAIRCRFKNITTSVACIHLALFLNNVFPHRGKCAHCIESNMVFMESEDHLYLALLLCLKTNTRGF